MAFAYQLDGQWVEIAGAFSTEQGGYPPGWAEGSTPEERAAAGVVEIAETDVSPKGHQRLIGVEIADVAGQPMRQGVYEELTLLERQTNFLAQVREARWAHEQGGFTTPAGPVRSDDQTQAKVSGALLLFTYDPTRTALDWELAPGVFAAITYAQLQALGLSIGAHVQACFTRSRQLTEAALAATSHAELTALDISAGWPA